MDLASEFFSTANWQLNNRELASLTILAFMLLVALYTDFTRTGKSLVAVIKAALAPKLLILFFIYGFTVVMLVIAAHKTGLWDYSMLKDALILSSVTALPLLLGTATKAKSLTEIWHPIRRDTLGASSILVAYVNLYPLSYWAEVTLQFLGLILALLPFTAKSSNNFSAQGTKNFVQGAQVILGTILIGWSSMHLWHASQAEFLRIIRSLIFEFYVIIAFLPFVYGVALLMKTESAVVRIRLQGSKPTWKQKMRLILGFRGKLSYASAFIGGWIYFFPRTPQAELPQFMARFRAFVDEQQFKEEKRQKQLCDFSGVIGRSASGLWFDRREFHETKAALSSLVSVQMGQKRNQLRYNKDLHLIIPVAAKDLPEENGIHYAVSDDAQRWFAWRKTIGGCHLGVGGTENADLEWRYAESEAPKNYPGGSDPGWVALESGSESLDWVHNDEAVSFFPSFEMFGND